MDASQRKALEVYGAKVALRRGRLLDEVERCYRQYTPAQLRPGTTTGKAWRDVRKARRGVEFSYVGRVCVFCNAIPCSCP